MASSNPRRDVLLLMGFSVACLVPILLLTRLRGTQTPIPTPVPQKPVGPISPLGPLAFSPDGRVLAGVRPPTGPSPKTAVLILWRLSDGKQLRQMQVNSNSTASLLWSPDSRIIQNSGMWVERWNAVTGKRLSRPLKLLPSPPPPLTKRPDFKKFADIVYLSGVATFGEDIEVRRHGTQSMQIFTATKGRRLGEWETGIIMDPSHSMTRLSPSRPTRLSYKVLVLKGKTGQKSRGADLAVQMWDVKNKRQLWQKVLPPSFPSGDFSPDGKYFVIWGLTRPNAKGAAQNTAWVLDAATGKKLFEFEPNDKTTEAVAFGTSGNRFVSVGQDVLGTHWPTTARIHRVDTGKLVEALRLPEKHNSVTSTALSKDGTLLATSDYYGIQLWKIRDLETKGQSATPKLLATPSPAVIPAPAPRLPIPNTPLKMPKRAASTVKAD